MILMILQFAAACASEGVKVVQDFGAGNIAAGISDSGVLLGWILFAFHIHVTIPGFLDSSKGPN